MSTLIYDKTLIKKQDLGLYSGDIAVIPDKFNGHPRLNWSGSIIDIDQFRLALAFLKWTHDQHHVEGQIRLFYNEFTREWKTVALPQYIWSAGHTREVEEENPVKSAIIESLLNSGFGQAGTGHHHSNMNAFQSGGDQEDELSQNGFHFTVGHMSSTVADFHCRATFRKINYDPNQGMLDPNQWLPGLHNRFIQDKEIAALWLSLTDLPPFPEEWKTYLIAKPEPVVQHWRANTGFGYREPGCNNTQPGTQANLPLEMFRDGAFCIRFKPSNPYVSYRFYITAKPTKCAVNAADIIRPIPQPITATLQQPTQAEINQKHLEELEEKKIQEGVGYGELVVRVSTMSQSEYDDFCQNLRDDSLKLLAEQLPVNDLSTPRGRVIDRLEECLAEFRDEAMQDSCDADDIKNTCDALQELSRNLVKDIEAVTIKHNSYLYPYLTMDALQSLLIRWGSALFEQLLTQGTPEEWNAIYTECSTPVSQALDFYATMRTGLKKAIAHEMIDPVYNDDGTLAG